MSFLRRPGSSQQQCVAAVLAGGLLCLPFAAVAQAAPQGSTALAMNNPTGSLPAGRPYRYRLGPGDQLSMTVFKMNGYEANVEVLSDGTINLPRIGTIEVWGLTLEEAKQLITDSYARILRRPLVHLDLVAPRPIKVTVTGDVETPGVFSLPAKGEGGWPTLVDVVQRAGGIGATGDLSRLELIRPSQMPGGQPTRYTFDYLSVLREGGHAPTPLIYDGDSIRVYKSETLNNADMITAAASNFAPDTIKVNVIGEVANPGVVEVPSNSPVSRAILATGGITRRGSDNTVELIRVDGEGKPTVKRLGFNPKATLSSPTNPPLRQGDVLVVNRNQLAKVTDSMSDALEPFNPIIKATSIFRLLGLPVGGLLGF